MDEATTASEASRKYWEGLTDQEKETCLVLGFFNDNEATRCRRWMAAVETLEGMTKILKDLGHEFSGGEEELICRSFCLFIHEHMKLSVVFSTERREVASAIASRVPTLLGFLSSLKQKEFVR